MSGTSDAGRAAARWRRALSLLGRLVAAVGRDVAFGPLALHAGSLTYTTLLSLVPLLALSFSVLKGLGAGEQLEPLLYEALKPLGESANVVFDLIMGFVGRVEAGVLGAFGLGLLAYTAISVLQKIEEALNAVWRVSEPRNWGRRFTDYLSVLLVGPLLLAAGLGSLKMVRERAVAQGLADSGLGSAILDALVRFSPFAFVVGVFTVIYLLMPNTRVRFLPALIGAVVGSLLWVGASWAFATFVAASTSYTAIYSAFAAAVLFLIWLNVNWLLLLVGGSVGFYVQNPEYLGTGSRSPEISAEATERLALALAAAIAGAQYRRQPPPTARQLAAATGAPVQTVTHCLDTLAAAGVIEATAGTPPGYLSRTPPDATPVADVLTAARRGGGGPRLQRAEICAPASVDAALARIDVALPQALDGLTLKEVAIADPADAAATARPEREPAPPIVT